MPEYLASKAIRSDQATSPPLCAFDRENRHVFAAHLLQGVIAKIDCDRGEVVDHIPVSSRIWALGVSDDGNELIAVSDFHLIVWSTRLGHQKLFECAHGVDFDIDSWPPTISHDHDDTWVLFGEAWFHVTNGEAIRYQNPATGNLVALRQSGSGVLQVVTLDPSPDKVRSATFSLWGVATSKCESTLEVTGIRDFACNSNGTHLLLVPTDEHHALQLASFETGQIVPVVRNRRSGSWISGRFCSTSRLISVVLSSASGPKYSVYVHDIFKDVEYRLDDYSLPPVIACSHSRNLIALIANDRRHPIDRTSFRHTVDGKEVAHTKGHMGLGGIASFSNHVRWFASSFDMHSADLMSSPLQGGGIVLTDLGSLSLD